MKAIEADPQCYNALALLGHIKMIKCDYDEAIEWFMKSIEVTPRSPDLLKETFGALEDCKLRVKLIKEHKLVRKPISCPPVVLPPS